MKNELVAGPHHPTQPVEGGYNGESLNRHETQDRLEPGNYWRVVKPLSVEIEDWAGHYFHFKEEDLHLLVDLVEFEGAVHSAVVLGHPRNTRSTFARQPVLLADFLSHFEPVLAEDAEATRSREQENIMGEVEAIQREMSAAQVNPLALPAVQEAVEAAIASFNQKDAARVQAEEVSTSRREADLRRIHKRAARRSATKGNPITLRGATISDRLDVMIAEGVTAETSRELSLEAGRRLAMATAVSGWLQERGKALASTLAQLTPYLMEKGEVAMAKSRRAINFVGELQKGIASLKLYTGEGVDVVAVREGRDAESSEPLTVFQAKRFMDEELAVWADVDESFDWTDQGTFFKFLASNDALLDQMLPAPRCVVSVAVTRRRIEYSSNTDPYQLLINEIQNKRVFLLVRNGQNVFAVYSCEPSHEAAKRLFPTREDIRTPFVGRDGTGIGLADVAFGKASARFEDQSLHYMRFLILLCGLDHRERLFGDFYPREKSLSFMSREFQAQYLRFIEDDDGSLTLPQDAHIPVGEWLASHNKNLRSGSRVVVGVLSGMRDSCPMVRKQYALDFTPDARNHAYIVETKERHLCIRVPATARGDGKLVTVWLDGPSRSSSTDWFLCLDMVELHEVERYIHSRRNRAGSISWLRTLRRAHRILSADLLAEAELRAGLRQAALSAGILSEDQIEAAIQRAIGVWRADHRGAAAPAAKDKKEVAALLTLLYPSDLVGASMRPLVEEFAQAKGLFPLKLTRDGKSRLNLYVEVPGPDREVLGGGMIWGWVRRMVITVKDNRISESSSSLAWLRKDIEDPTEVGILEWAGLANWLNPLAEPFKPAALQRWKERVDQATWFVEEWSAGTSEDGIPEELFISILKDMNDRRNRTYFTRSWVALPVGMYQTSRESPPVKVFMVCAAMPLVMTHGSHHQRLKLLDVCHRSKAGMDTSGTLQWAIMTTTKNITGFSVEREDLSTPPWTRFTTHTPGGIAAWSRRDKRAARRRAGGSPQLRSTEAVLSFNRAFDTLLEASPLNRRVFYKSVNDRVRLIFGFDQENIPELRAQERKRRYPGRAPEAVALSPLVWNAQQQRSMANRHFSGKCANAVASV